MNSQIYLSEIKQTENKNIECLLFGAVRKVQAQLSDDYLPPTERFLMNVLMIL